MAVALTNAQVRAFLNAINVGPDVAPTNASNTSPAVVTAAGHGFHNGDFIWQWGFATNTAMNGLFYVFAATTNTYEVSLTLGGTPVNGNGAHCAGHAQRLTTLKGVTPHDLKNMIRTMESMSYVRDSDASAAKAIPLESTLQTIFGQ